MRASKGRGADDDLVGPSEIAERLGVQRSTVAKWLERHADFPRPRATIGAGRRAPRGASSGTPIWNWADVEAWAITTGRAK